MPKKPGIQPPMPKHLSIEGGRRWTRKTVGVAGYSSDDGNFDVLQGDGYVVLVSFIHEPNTDAEFWQRRFSTAADAITFAERI